jgi:hypothetical protein
VSNDWETENRIINEFKKWIRNNKHLNEIEIYYIINSKQQDKILKEEFSQFILKHLLFSKMEINDFKVERALTLISLSKNKYLNINDLRQYILINIVLSERSEAPSQKLISLRPQLSSLNLIMRIKISG